MPENFEGLYRDPEVDRPEEAYRKVEGEIQEVLEEIISDPKNTEQHQLLGEVNYGFAAVAEANHRNFWEDLGPETERYRTIFNQEVAEAREFVRRILKTRQVDLLTAEPYYTLVISGKRTMPYPKFEGIFADIRDRTEQFYASERVKGYEELGYIPDEEYPEYISELFDITTEFFENKGIEVTTRKRYEEEEEEEEY